MAESIDRIGVFTSGGDAPGMNAANRAVVRTGTYHSKEVFGIARGYEGMIDGEIFKLGVRSVANIIQRGGTILKSARCPAFKTREGRAMAFENLKENGINSLVAIGGDGTFAGLRVFYEEYGIRSMCVPGTIDNDLPGTDFTIGYDTATNTAVEAIDKIRDTAMSHNRLFFVEVMGRDSGQIAINSGLAGGAIAIIIPEDGMTFEQLAALLEGSSEDKKSNVVVVAEGSKIGGAMELARKFRERSSYFDTKVTVLGHLQRGGAPSYFDRVLASKMGVAAVEGLLEGKTGMMVGIRGGQIVFNDFETIQKGKRHFDEEALRIARILSI